MAGIKSALHSFTVQKLQISEAELRRMLVENLGSLRRFSYSLTGNGSDGDDLVQGTVERLLNKGVPVDVPFAAWMFRVCKNYWIDQLRTQSRTQAVDPDEIERNLKPVDGEAVALGMLRMREVNMAIRKLDPDQRMVLALVTVEGNSYSEAADILEIPIGTVMSRLARARKSLLEMTDVGN